MAKGKGKKELNHIMRHNVLHHDVVNRYDVRRLEPAFFDGPTEELAHRLLGTTLVRRLPMDVRLSGIIVEVEPYLGDGDAASDSARGLTPRCASMFSHAGTLYVYAIHSRYCLNIVSEPAGTGSAVLIRGLEPLDGIELMAMHRRANLADFQRSSHRRSLTAGPGRICEAMQVDRRLDGIDLTISDEMWLESPCRPVELRRQAGEMVVRSSTRIGISQSQEMRLRYFYDGNHFVSDKASEHSRGRTWSFTSGAP